MSASSRGSSSRTGVCIQEGGGVCIQEGGLHPGGGLPKGSASRRGVCIQGSLQPGEWTYPSKSDTTGYSQRAGGMHPTQMHSCFFS